MPYDFWLLPAYNVATEITSKQKFGQYLFSVES